MIINTMIDVGAIALFGSLAVVAAVLTIVITYKALSSLL